MKRTLLRCLCFFIGFTVLSSCSPSKKVNVFSDAIAVWHMATLNDSTVGSSSLKVYGLVTTGILLTGNELKASLERGGDGYVAKFDGGYLDGVQGLNDELKLSGSSASFAVRLCNPYGSINGAILGKFGDDTTVAYCIYADSTKTGRIFAAGIGSDEIDGIHRLQSGIMNSEGNIWHDVVVRFDGKISQLFIDGNLCDDEVSVGTIRSKNNSHFLIGAEFAENDTSKNMIPGAVQAALSNFRGLIDHAAIWNRALSDAEIAKLSNVDQLGDKRPKYYTEKYRPQFHFTPRKSWMNDPNGLVYYKGVYHMSYQHMPPGRPGAYKDWGQAISTDLIHWKVLTSSLTPHKTWGGCWSGSAVVDKDNTTGLKSGVELPIIAILTNGGVPGKGPQNTQCIAYSNDGGMSFTYYDKNPVLKHIVAENRDPKVVWFAPAKKWILALYLTGNDYGIFTSTDMKSWKQICTLTLPGVSECPDLFELPVDGNKSITKWVFWGASGNYLIGTFDGQTFKTESKLLKADYGKNFYAAQTFSDIPETDGRRIQIGWMADGVFGPKVVKDLDLAWDQQMGFPTEVTLRTTSEGIQMCRVPVREIALLHDKETRFAEKDLKPGENLFKGISGDLFDIVTVIETGTARSFDIIVRGTKIHYNCLDHSLSCLGGTVSLKPEKGQIKLQILVDRTSLEIFGNDGTAVISSCFLPLDENKELATASEGGSIKIISTSIYSLKSIWQ
jgi:sucrose-6-phosphate hydrolase SacC (GH32 family)